MTLPCENAHIARLFLDGKSFAELAEKFPDRDVEEAVREYRLWQTIEGLERRQGALKEAFHVLLEALATRPSKSPPSGKIDSWTRAFDKWLRDTVDPAVERALELAQEAE